MCTCVHMFMYMHVCASFHCLSGLLTVTTPPGQPWGGTGAWVEGCRNTDPSLRDSQGGRCFCSPGTAVKQGQSAFVSSSCGRIRPRF